MICSGSVSHFTKRKHPAPQNMDSIKEATDKASHAIDEGFSRATEAIHNGASTAQTQYSWARTRAEVSLVPYSS